MRGAKMMESTQHDHPADEAREEEATSSETLAEIEETAKVSSATDSTSGPADANPAPDGTPDPDHGATADSRKSGEPM
jgi:hypothetical protein